MSEFEVVEIPFEELDMSPTLEDEFLEARITAEIDQASDVDELKDAAKKLLKVAIARQAAIRGLCKRLIQFETASFNRTIREEWTLPKLI